MRNDLNLVGGTVDTLSYEYVVLKQIIDSFIEQQRIQSVYNEYSDDIRKIMNITNTVLNVLALALVIKNAIATLKTTGSVFSLTSTGTYTNGGGGGGGGLAFHGVGFPGTGTGEEFKSLLDSNFTSSILHFAEQIFAKESAEELMGQFASSVSTLLIALQILNASKQIANQFTAAPDLIKFMLTPPDEKFSMRSQMGPNHLTFSQVINHIAGDDDDDETYSHNITVNKQVITRDTCTQTEEGTLK